LFCTTLARGPLVVVSFSCQVSCTPASTRVNATFRDPFEKVVGDCLYCLIECWRRPTSFLEDARHHRRKLRPHCVIHPRQPDQ
jgi:hypothetical protein